jgi:excisionase family DNA binding protein
MTTQAHIKPIALSIPDAARACGVSERTMWRMLRAQNLPQRKVGRCTVILYDDLKAYIEKQKV